MGLELVVIVLNKVEFLTEILNGFVDEGIRGATAINSSGMGRIMAEYIPFFARFADLEDENKNHSKTVFTVVNSTEERDKVVKIVEDTIGNIDEPDTAFIFSVPVNFVKGLNSRGGNY